MAANADSTRSSGAEILKKVLQQLGLSTLIDSFLRERIDDETAVYLNDGDLVRLGIETIGDRHRFRSHLKSSKARRENEAAPVAPGRVVQQVTDAYNNQQRFGRFGNRRLPNSRKAVKRNRFTGWTGQFFCLSSNDSSVIPSSSEKELLRKAGFGFKKIRLENSDNEEMVIEKLMSGDRNEDSEIIGFPQLKESGGIELLRTSQNCRDLKLIGCKWNSKELKLNVGSQAKIYIRPVQKTLKMTPMNEEMEEEEEGQCFSTCENCKRKIKMREMRKHLDLCINTQVDNLDDDFDILSTIMHRTVTNNLGQAHREAENQLPDLPNLSQSDIDNLGQLQPRDTLIPVEEHSTGDYIQLTILPSDGSDSEIRQQNGPETLQQNENELSLKDVVKQIINFCREKEIQNPVEILRKAQNDIVTGRELEIKDINSITSGDINYIMIDRDRVLETAFDELDTKTDSDLRNTLQVQFYGEVAEDLGGPRKEFFRLILIAIKEKYFDNGLRELLADDYRKVGIIFALSILQNGKMPCFISDDILKELWDTSKATSICLANLRTGLDSLGLFELMTELPSLQFLMHRATVILTVQRLMSLLKPIFSESGSNKLASEKAVYGLFIKYVREVASGRRNGLNLGSILQFVTGTDEEPVLGFALQPSLEFCEVIESFIPTSNTCINRMIIPRPSSTFLLPAEEKIFELYDYAFHNSYYGLK